LKTIEQPIMAFLSNAAVAASQAFEVTPHTRLLETDLLDSIGLVGLIQFLESEFDLEIPDRDLVPELFETPQTIADYVAKRLARTPSAPAFAEP
jgi:acyl carrier protein